MKRSRVDDETFSCRRRTSSETSRTRKIHVVYTDLFLDTLNYTHDVQILRDRFLTTNGGGKTLLVLSQLIYNTVQQNENTNVLCGGRCYITTPSISDHHTLSEYVMSNPPISDLIFFNVDPFVHCETPKNVGGAASVPPTVSALCRTPLGAVFERYVKDDNTKCTMVFNTFLLRTGSVVNFETNRRMRISFDASVLSVHDTDGESKVNTVCNFCTDALPATQTRMHVYTIGSGKPVPSLRALGSAATDTLTRSDSLVLLDVSADQGGPTAATEYYRFKQFYYSFAHGRKNKWGVRLGDIVPLQTHLRSWNLMLREELKRWHWVLRKDARSSDEDVRRKIKEVYVMRPCVLNLDIARDVCAAAKRNNVLTSDIRESLMAKFDTSTFNVRRIGSDDDTGDRAFARSLVDADVSVTDAFVTTSRPHVSVAHNRFFRDLVG